MTETDLQRGGGYTYQWECAILLALNYFFKPLRYNSTLFDLVHDFLGQVEEIHLEGEDRESDLDLEDINLVDASGERRILIQVKTKQAEGERWTPTDALLLKSLYRFYDSRFFAEPSDDTRFVFLTNRAFNPALVRVKAAIRESTVSGSADVDKLYQHLARYARREKGKAIDAGRFRQMLARTALVEYLAVEEVKANVQAKLDAYGRRDWEQAHATLFEHFARQSTRIGGGTVTRASVIEVLGPSPEPALRDKEVGITLMKPKAGVATELLSQIERGETLLRESPPSSQQELNEWSRYWHDWRRYSERILRESFSSPEPLQWLKDLVPRHLNFRQSWEVRAKDFSRDIEAELALLKNLLVRLDNY